jgi:hypothetical protein
MCISISFRNIWLNTLMIHLNFYLHVFPSIAHPLCYLVISILGSRPIASTETLLLNFALYLCLVARTAGSGWLWCNIKLYTESTYAGLMLILLLYLEVGICCPGTNKGIGICYGQSCRCVLYWLQQF